jgi:outer membrane receptor for monomeric catechols
VVAGQREQAEVESPKATAPLLDTPQTVTVVSDQVIRKQNLLTLRDALATIPGSPSAPAKAAAATAIRSTCAAIRPTTT